MAVNYEELQTLNGSKIGFALCGSFCTFEKAFSAMERLVSLGAELTPIMSFNAYSTDTRFGTAEDMRRRAENICGKKIIATIEDAEPVGPKKMFDLLICAPCTGNTVSKLACDIIDTPVTMAVKSHLRNGSPVLIAVSTNDALSAAAENIGKLLSRRCYYFVPFGQDDPQSKPASAVADFTQIPAAAAAALKGRQLRPIIMSYS